MYSVVIPAYNEEKLIGLCLDALTKQDTQEKFEVILIDNNSTDKTVKIASEFEKQLNLRIVSQEIKGRGPARAKGFSAARGEIIFSTDADTIVPPDWIRVLSENLKKSKGVAVSGTCKMYDCSPYINILFNLTQPLMMKSYRLAFGHFWLSGFNSAIYKEAYEESGGFDTTMNAQEDIELSFRVSKIGKIVFVPNTPVIFSGRRFHKGFGRGLREYMGTFSRLFFLKDKKIVLSDER